MTNSSPKKRVLLVEDGTYLRELMKRHFESDGFEVLQAKEGGEGFQIASQQLPDCVLLDVRFSEGENGLVFLRRLRSYRHDDPEIQNRVRKMPVIIVTGSGTAMRPLFEVEGISDYIEKPFDFNDLKARVLKASS